jgi:hypothetical protein
MRQYRYVERCRPKPAFGDTPSFKPVQLDAQAPNVRTTSIRKLGQAGVFRNLRKFHPFRAMVKAAR